MRKGRRQQKDCRAAAYYNPPLTNSMDLLGRKVLRGKSAEKPSVIGTDILNKARVHLKHLRLSCVLYLKYLLTFAVTSSDFGHKNIVKM